MAIAALLAFASILVIPSEEIKEVVAPPGRQYALSVRRIQQEIRRHSVPGSFQISAEKAASAGGAD